MGWIEEGLWGLAQKTGDNYLIAVDALMPGYKEDFERNAQELSESVERAWNDLWETTNWSDEQLGELQFISP